jgi:O-antigen/teichoic acid export membrane protein
MATTSILGILSCGCYEHAIVTCKTFVEAANVLVTALGVVAITSAMCIGAAIVWQEELNAALGAPGSGVVWLLPVAIAAVGYSEAVKHWFLRAARFNDAASSRVWQAAWGSTIQIGMGFGRVLGGTGLVAGRVTGILLSGVILQRRVDTHERRRIQRAVSIRHLLATAALHKGFPVYLAGSLVLAQLAYWAPAYLLAIYYGAHVVGSYALIVRVISAPMQFVGDAFQKVLFQRASDQTAHNILPSDTITRTLAYVLALAVVPCALLMLFGRKLFVSAFGSSWALSGDMASWLAPVVFLNFLVSPLHPVFSVQGRQNAFFWLQVGKVLMAVLPVIICGSLHADVRVAMFGYTAGQSLMFIMTLIFILRCCGLSPRGAAQGVRKVYLGFIRFA